MAKETVMVSLLTSGECGPTGVINKSSSNCIMSRGVSFF